MNKRAGCSSDVPQEHNIAMVQASLAEQTRNEAFGEIYKEYRLLVRHCLYRIGIREDDVEDLMQQVFMTALQKLHQLQEPAALPGWLSMIAYNVGRTFHRRFHLLMSISEHEENIETAMMPSARTANRSQFPIDAEEAIGMLDNPVDQQMVREFYLDELTMEEMTRIPDIGTNHCPPIGTIKRRLHTIRGRLQEMATTGGQLEPTQ